MKNPLLLVFLFLPILGLAQITIDFPRERMTYQRDNNNQAKIYISGNFTAEYDSIRARVLPRVSGQGIATSWKKIALRDGKPYFSGDITVTGGWYKLEVEAFKGSSSIALKTVERVGVGEVFVIAGQSNATGTTSGTVNGMYITGAGYGIDTNEDRCNVMHYANKTNEYNKLPIGYSQMSGASVGNDSIFIGPSQLASWCWGKLAETLVSTLNVPVMFYGAGFGGTSVLWWKQSANGENLTNQPFFVQQQYNHPYGALGSVMKYYSSLTGIRAVLWHQGEADHSMQTSDYKYNLEQVIARTRQQIESPTFAWMVARASYAGGPSSSVISAQNQVISADTHVYSGPETDNLGSSYRTDNVHLDKQNTFIDHASLWHTRITVGNFLTASVPVLAQPFIDLSFSCNTANPSLPISLSTATSGTYAWSNRNNTAAEAIGNASDYGQNYTIQPNNSYLRLNWGFDSTNTINVAAGKFALNITKTSGKRLFSPYVDLASLTVPSTPNITSSKLQVRPNDSVTLTGSSCSSTYVWSNSLVGNPIQPVIASNSSFYVQCKNLHCISTNSNTVNIVASSCFSGAISLTGQVSNGELPYQSKLNVNSIQNITNGGSINYTAKNAITLNPGFKAEHGSTFSGKIEDCN